MKKNIFIPGDLVMTNGVPISSAKGVIYRVTSSYPNRTLKIEGYPLLKGAVYLENIKGTNPRDKGYLFAECCAWVKDIVPIKLSPKILKENGWIPDEDCPKQHFTLKKQPRISLWSNKGKWTIAVDNYFLLEVTNRYELESVSDLQHFLFGLGYNDEMMI